MANKFLNVVDLSLNKIINVANGTENNDVVNLGQLNTAINTVVGGLASALEYKGTLTLVEGDTLASILTKAGGSVAVGDFYIINETVEPGPVTIEGIDYNHGDHVVFNTAVESGGTLESGHIDLIKNTEFPGMVFVDATQTLTQKTIDADNNFISNLETDNLKDGVLNIDLDARAALNTQVPSALAVQTHVTTEVTALETKVTNLLHTEDIVGDANAVDFVVNHALASAYPMVQVIDVANNAIVYPAVELTDANNVTIKFGIAPALTDTYKVIVWGTNFPA